MMISDGPTNRNWNRTVFKGTKAEVDREVEEYLGRFPHAGYMTMALKPQKITGSEPELYQVRVDRLLSCD